MAEATSIIRIWSRNNGKKVLPNSWKLTNAKLSLKSNKYCHLLGKGWHTSVLLDFLADWLVDVDVDPLMKTAVFCCHNVVHLLQRARKDGIWLTSQQAEQVQSMSHAYLSAHLTLHQKFVGWCPIKLFNCRPKIHMWQHMCEYARVSLKNPVSGATWMDEDWIRGIMRLAGACHQRTAHFTSLKRYLTGQYALLDALLCTELGNRCDYPGLKRAMVDLRKRCGL